MTNTVSTTDYSANPAAVPISSYVLLITMPVNRYRKFVEAQNQSANLVQLVMDDGAGNNQSTVMLAAATAAPGAGGYWFSEHFQGRIRLYGATSSTQQVMLREDVPAPGGVITNDGALA